MEEWRDIKGFPGYQVSDLGRVRTHNKVTKSAKFERRVWKDRIMKQKVNKQDNYSRVELWKENGEHKTILVHRLVADAFLEHSESEGGGRGNMMTVNHINRNRQDNRLINLEWLTLADNIRAAFATGCGTEKACTIKSESGTSFSFKSLADASRFLDRPSGYVSNATHKGHRLRDRSGVIYELV